MVTTRLFTNFYYQLHDKVGYKRGYIVPNIPHIKDGKVMTAPFFYRHRMLVITNSYHPKPPYYRLVFTEFRPI